MTVRKDVLAMSSSGEPAFYPYGGQLYVYDPPRHLLAPLGDRAAAKRYFREAGRVRKPCPPGDVGHGVLI